MIAARFRDWIFDLDNTLYPASCRLFDQVEARMAEFIAGLLGVGPEEARRIQKRYFLDHGTTLRGLMVHHQVKPERFLEHVHAIDVDAVAPAPALDRVLGRLPGRKFIYTNGSTAHAEKVMARLGVSARFDGIFDIAAADYLAKPAPQSLDRLIAWAGIEPGAAILFEDLPRNLIPAAALGITTVLVKTESEWAQDGADSAEIDFITEDLVAWLEAAIAPD